MTKVIALRNLYKNQPGEVIEVSDRDAKVLVQIGYAKWPDDEPPSSETPSPRRSYRRRDLTAER